MKKLWSKCIDILFWFFQVEHTEYHVPPERMTEAVETLIKRCEKEK